MSKKVSKETNDNIKERRNFGSIRQKSANSWEILYHFNGKRYSESYSTEKEANARLLKVEADTQLGQFKVGDGMTLDNWLTKWLDTYILPTTKNSTYVNYRQNCENHVIPKLGRITLRKLTVDHIQKFFNEKAISGRLDEKEGGLSLKTLRNIRSTLNEAFVQAISLNLMTFNPISGLKLARFQSPEMRVLTIAEQEALENVVFASLKTTALGIVIDLNTGLRLGELLGLQWRDLHLNVAHPYFDVVSQLTRQTNTTKTDKDAILIRKSNKTSLWLSTLKTEKASRRFYMPNFVVDCFKKILDWQNEIKQDFGEGYNPWGFVFCTELGDVFDPRTYTEVFYKMCRAAGVEDANFHCMRHTFATRCVEKDIDYSTLAGFLGHAKASTSMDMYVHSLDDERIKAISAFDRKK